MPYLKNFLMRRQAFRSPRYMTSDLHLSVFHIDSYIDPPVSGSGGADFLSRHHHLPLHISHYFFLRSLTICSSLRRHTAFNSPVRALSNLGFTREGIFRESRAYIPVGDGLNHGGKILLRETFEGRGGGAGFRGAAKRIARSCSGG